MGIMVHRPLFGNILGKKIYKPTVETQPVIHGIIHINTPPTPHHYVEVLKIGPGPHIWHGQVIPRDELGFKEGDVIMVNAVAGVPESVEGEEYHRYTIDEFFMEVPRPAYPEFVS